MTKKTEPIAYSPLEEKVNIGSHAFGFISSIIALALLIIKSSKTENVLIIVSSIIFGLSLIVLYAASTLYHRAKSPELRNRLRIFDHAAIYVLIAGTYTPFVLITLQGVIGWAIFGISWGIALTGIILKLFYTGRFSTLSTIMYVGMGWIIVFAIKPLINNLSTEGLLWLSAGGVAYTLGAVIYSIKKIKFNHATFHLLVLIGSFCHFMSIYLYVI